MTGAPMNKKGALINSIGQDLTLKDLNEAERKTAARELMKDKSALKKKVEQKIHQRKAVAMLVDRDTIRGLILELISSSKSDHIKATLLKALLNDMATSGENDPKTVLEQFKNCLLYTSPSPRDRQKSRMPSSA